MNIVFLLTVLISLQLSINCFPTAESDLIVTTKLGKIRGHEVTLDDNKTAVNVFEGIPFAKPPIGDLRFKKPVKSLSWNDTLNATMIKHACMQLPFSISLDMMMSEFGQVEGTPDEDCLYLKVWQPANHSNKKKAVMFWIHGGGFTTGTAFSVTYDARYIAALGDVIVVTINYRLGAWGFLSGGSEQYPGNLGLYDQIMALQWTKDHIASFGGDPEQITIFGESAGGMSVGALVLSPLTKGLFKRAIMQSGGPNSLMGGQDKEDMIKNTNELAKELKCNETDFSEKVKCIAQSDNKDILKFMKKATLNGIIFSPYYGDSVLPIKPSEALKTGKFNQNIDIIFGNVKDEGSRFVAAVFKDLMKPHPNITKSKSYGYIYSIFLLLKNDVKFATEVATFYTRDLTDKDGDKLAMTVGNSFGDFILTCPTILFGSWIARWSKQNHAYAYRMSHKPGMSAMPGCEGWMGVCHGDDDLLLFGFPIRLRGIGFNEADYKASIDLIEAWTHFAKTGKPSSLGGTEWNEGVDHQDSKSLVKIMELNPTNYHMVKDFYKNTCEGFWKSHLE